MLWPLARRHEARRSSSSGKAGKPLDAPPPVAPAPAGLPLPVRRQTCPSTHLPACAAPVFAVSACTPPPRPNSPSWPGHGRVGGVNTAPAGSCAAAWPRGPEPPPMHPAPRPPSMHLAPAPHPLSMHLAPAPRYKHPPRRGAMIALHRCARSVRSCAHAGALQRGGRIGRAVRAPRCARRRQRHVRMPAARTPPPPPPSRLPANAIKWRDNVRGGGPRKVAQGNRARRAGGQGARGPSRPRLVPAWAHTDLTPPNVRHGDRRCPPTPGALPKLAQACPPPPPPPASLAPALAPSHPPTGFPEAANACFPARAIEPSNEAARRTAVWRLAPAPEPMATKASALNRRAPWRRKYCQARATPLPVCASAAGLRRGVNAWRRVPRA